MSLAEAWREFNEHQRRFRKEVVNGNTEKAREHWERASALWEAIGGVVR